MMMLWGPTLASSIVNGALLREKVFLVFRLNGDIYKKEK